MGHLTGREIFRAFSLAPWVIPSVNTRCLMEKAVLDILRAVPVATHSLHAPALPFAWSPPVTPALFEEEGPTPKLTNEGLPGTTCPLLPKQGVPI